VKSGRCDWRRESDSEGYNGIRRQIGGKLIGEGGRFKSETWWGGGVEGRWQEGVRVG